VTVKIKIVSVMGMVMIGLSASLPLVMARTVNAGDLPDPIASPFDRIISTSPPALASQHIRPAIAFMPVALFQHIPPKQPASLRTVSDNSAEQIFALIMLDAPYLSAAQPVSMARDNLLSYLIGDIYAHSGADAAGTDAPLAIGPLPHPKHADLYCLYLMQMASHILSSCKAGLLRLDAPHYPLSGANIALDTGAQDASSEIIFAREGDIITADGMMLVKTTSTGIVAADSAGRLHSAPYHMRALEQQSESQ